MSVVATKAAATVSRNLLLQRTRPTSTASILRTYHASSVALKPKKRGIPPKGRKRDNATKKPEPPAAAPAAAPAAEEPSLATRVDPHAMAAELVKKSPDARVQGTESLASLTPQQKMQNYGTAALLVGFVTSVWWYSMTSVGKAEGGIEDLQAEAMEARDTHEKEEYERKEAEKLVDLEKAVSNLEDEEGGELISVEDVGDVLKSVSPGDVPAEEVVEGGEDASPKNKDGRPLWKKIVFFWRRQ